MEYLVIIKIVAIYFIILLVMKFMGKREIGQLSLFDFIVILIIADISVSGMESEGQFFTHILGIFILGIIQKVLAFLSLRFRPIRSFFDGKQSLIIIEGKINIKEMRKQNYNIDDLIIQMRLKNIRSISEIRYLILEANGEISTFLFDDYPTNSSPATTKSQNVVVGINNSETVSKSDQIKEIYPFPVIVSGKLIKENMNILNLTEKFIYQQIRKKGYKDIKEIYYANYENGGLFIAETCDF